VSGRLKLGQILVNRGLLAPDQLASALADQQDRGARLGMTLVRMGFVDEETLIRTLAGQVKLPVARIRGKRVSPDVLECIPVDLAEKHRCLPLFFKQEGGERVLFIAMEDPSDSDAIDALASASGQVLRPVLVGPTELEEALQRHYHWASLTGEMPEWLVDRSSSEGGGPGNREPDPEAAAESPADPEDDEAGWAAEPGADGDLDVDLGGDEAGLGLDFESDAGEESELEGDADPLSEALLPAAPSLGALAEADTSPELPELGAERSDEDAHPLEIEEEFGLSEAPRAQAGAQMPRLESLEPSIILRALAQLLVEKGVISRDEFVQRLGELAAREAGRG
jgi:type IV pilus assembly protein PilB